MAKPVRPCNHVDQPPLIHGEDLRHLGSQVRRHQPAGSGAYSNGAAMGRRKPKRVNERRDVKRVGSKKAEHVAITDDQADALKAQPIDTPQGAGMLY